MDRLTVDEMRNASQTTYSSYPTSQTVSSKEKVRMLVLKLFMVLSIS
jgi:hypothetical protein